MSEAKAGGGGRELGAQEGEHEALHREPQARARQREPPGRGHPAQEDRGGAHLAVRGDLAPHFSLLSGG